MNNLKRQVCWFICLITITLNVSAASKDLQITTAQIRNIVSAAVDEQIKKMQPYGTLLVATKDEVIYTRSFGFADMVKQIPDAENTQYLIGSVSKQFTAVAILKALYDQNIRNGYDKKDVNSLKSKIQADLNKPISYYLPNEHNIWAGSMPQWANVITAHHLLTHSSGLANYTDVSDAEIKKLSNTAEIISSIKNIKLGFKPGAKYSYCNSGYILLGEIISQITNQKLDLYMELVLFKPAEMYATFLATNGLVHDQSIYNSSHLARGYSFEISVPQAHLAEAKYWPMQLAGAAGGIISTAPDLVKWNNSLYTGKIIPLFLVDLILHGHINVNTESRDTQYGYGILIFNQDPMKMYAHNGIIPGFLSELAFYPKLQLSIVSLTNVYRNFDELIPEIKALKAKLPKNWAEDKKWSKIEKTLQNRYPSMMENMNRYDFMQVNKAVNKAIKDAVNAKN